MGRRSSQIWKYFHETEEGAVCKVKDCGRIIKRSGSSTNNFWVHMRLKHKAFAKKLAEAIEGTTADAEEASLSGVVTRKGQTSRPEDSIAHACTAERSSEETSVSIIGALEKALEKVSSGPGLESLTTQQEFIPLAALSRSQPRQSVSYNAQQQAEFIQSESKPTFLNTSSQSDQTLEPSFATFTSARDNQTEQSASDDVPLQVQPAEMLQAPNYLDTSSQFDRVSEATPQSASLHRYEDCRDVLIERIYRECVAFAAAEDASSRQQAVTWLEEDCKILKTVENAMK